MTHRLAESVGRLCQVMAIRHVARYFGLDWKTVKALDRARLQRELGPVDLDGLEVIALDEFAIPKGHRYATVIVEPTRKRVLWVGRDRGREDVRPYFELLGPQRCGQLRAAVTGMNASYELEVRRHCPDAAVVFDLFHVVAKYGREVIDRVRVDRANELRDDRPGRVRPPGLAQLVSQGATQPSRATATLRAEAPTLPARHPCSLPLAPWHQPRRRYQQQDQGHQADGLRLPRRRLPLPQNPGRLPRSWEMNLSKARRVQT